jgi:hypothetical protein
VVSSLGEPGEPHQHLAGWIWPRGFVSVAELRKRAEELAQGRGAKLNFSKS